MKEEKSTTSIWSIPAKKKSFFNRFKLHKSKSMLFLTPPVIEDKCEGIILGGVKVKSILFSTDLAIIENTQCDAVLAVYPFSPSLKIMKTLIDFCEKPVICGVGGGVTKGKVSLDMAVAAQNMGASAVIVNQPFKNSDLKKMRKLITIPIIASVSTTDFDFMGRLAAGTDIFNITGGVNTPNVIDKLLEDLPQVPFICTGGQSTGSLEKILDKKPSAIVLTPPSGAGIFKDIMEGYRSVTTNSVNKINRIFIFIAKKIKLFK